MADLGTARSIAVIGCGNPNRGDDGVGPAVIRLLMDDAGGRDGADVRLLDAGTDGMGVMFAAKGCATLIIIDACLSGAEAGAIFEVPGAEFDAPPRASFNLHDFRWDHALFAGRKMFKEAFPSDVRVYLVEVESLALGVGLSAKVAEAAEKVSVMIREVIERSLASTGSS